jgi:glutamate-1-semialdehyde aminotransferase
MSISFKPAGRTYQRTQEALSQAKALIPGGTTFSKDVLFRDGEAPFALKRGRKSTVWDVDGNSYTDFIMGLGALLLGYRHPDVDEAIREQLESGIAFSLMHPLETEVAHLLCEMIPSAEMVRYGKNGSDSTSAAVRLCRFVTGRDHVLFCGYHGWHDWYVAQTSRAGGVPSVLKGLAHRFEYNNLDSLQALFASHKDDVACVIIDPVNRWAPKDGFLHEVREMAHGHGALLVFDEVVTGFRFHRGGAQAQYGVTPDLSCFGKALANGMPLSALVGKADIMRRFDDIYYTMTAAGETLSLAAAKAVLQFLRKNDVTGHIVGLGARLKSGLEAIVEKLGLEGVIEVQGTPHRPILSIRQSPIFMVDPEEHSFKMVSFLVKALCAQGYLFNTSHFISWAHGQEDIEGLLKAHEQTLAQFQEFFCSK